jgi:MarR family transcriptional regulator, transcriptional regulator for hemolysin
VTAAQEKQAGPERTPTADTDEDREVPAWTRVEGTLMATARSVRRAYDAALAKVDLNLSEASVLAHLATGGPLPQVELARRIGTGRARIGAHIDSLERKGAVRRDADPADRRVWLVSVTRSGRRLWQRSVEVDRVLRRTLREGTTAAERDEVDRVLSRFRSNADRHAGGSGNQRT